MKVKMKDEFIKLVIVRGKASTTRYRYRWERKYGTAYVAGFIYRTDKKTGKDEPVQLISLAKYNRLFEGNE